MNRALTTIVRLVVTRGPDAVKWAGVVSPFVRDTANRERFTRLSQRLADARRARTPQARLEAEITALRDAATSALADAQDEATEERAQRWLRRAHRLDSSRRLISSTQGPARRRGLDQLGEQVDKLRDEVLAATLQEHEDPEPDAGPAAGQ